jgi:hypothetical protein
MKPVLSLILGTVVSIGCKYINHSHPMTFDSSYLN